jgi:hypothetical protein
MLAAMVHLGCRQTTARLSPELEARFGQEGVVHRADDQVFRYTWNSGSGWENRDASIVVTRRTVYIHKNGKVGAEITAGGRGTYEVRRDHERVIIRIGSGRSGDSWSFRPPDDAEGWARDIRAVIGAP